MKRYIRLFLILLLIIISVWWINLSYANNDKKIILSEKYNQKKVDKIKSTVKQKNNYRFLIKSDDFFEDVESSYTLLDKKIKVKDYGNGNYMIKIPHNSDLLVAYVNDIDNGILPTIIWWYDIVEPEIVESSSTQYLSWELVDNMWWMSYLGADLFQEELSSKNKINVAILDTGIDYTHIDLDDNYNTTLSYDFVNEDSDAMDDNWHGTQVAWIIWAEVNATWVYWVNSNSDLVGLKVLDVDWLGTSYDILEAIDYAKVNWIKVINMSFGWIGSVENNPICDAITDAKANWIYIVTSAGNNNTSIDNMIPASCSDVITIWAIDNLSEKASFSNYWTWVSLYAPWVDIYTTGLNGGYGNVSWTSHSAAFVSWLVSKELSYSWGISYDDLVGNVTSNYNLINYVVEEDNIENIVEENLIEYSTWFYINENNLWLFERFEDFTYFNIDDTYIYFLDKKVGDKFYRLEINQNFIFTPSTDYINFPKLIFRDSRNFDSLYFESWEYIDLIDYPYDDIFSSFSTNNYSTDEYIKTSLWKYDIDLKFDEIVWEKIIDLPWSILYEDDLYVYYRNSNDNYKLYKKAIDWSDLNYEWTKVIDSNYAYPTFIEWDYFYYRNYNDARKLYRIKNDWSEVLTWWIKIINSNTNPQFIEWDYIYYQNNNDNYKLYRIKKDWSEVNTWWTKVIDSNYAYPIFTEDDYIYYRNYNDNRKTYRIKKDWSEASTWWTKIIDSNSYPQLIEWDYLYYMNYEDNNNYYKIKKDWTEINTWWIKLSNITSWYSMYLHDDLDFLYLLIDEYPIFSVYKINKDWSGWIKIFEKYDDMWMMMMPHLFVFLDNYLLYTDEFNQWYLYKINNDGSDLTTWGILLNNKMYNYFLFEDNVNLYFSWRDDSNRLIYKINKITFEETVVSNKFGSYKDDDIDYIYHYLYDNWMYRYYKLKKDWTDNNLYLYWKNYTSNEISLDNWLEFIRVNVDEILPTWTDYNFYLSDDNSEFIELEKSKLSWNVDIDLISLFWVAFNHKVYFKVELVWDEDNPTITPEVSSVELFNWDVDLRDITDISIVWITNCTRPYYRVLLNLKGENWNLVYTSQQSSTKTSWWCWGSRVYWSRIMWNTCNLVDVLIQDDKYIIKYTCNSYYWISWWIGTGRQSHIKDFDWSGSFILDYNKYDLWLYNSELAHFSFTILPWETYKDYFRRLAEYTASITTSETEWDPINLSKWEFNYDNIVMQHNSKWFPFSLWVNYKSKVNYEWILGYNFDHTYNQYLEEQFDWNIYYYNWELWVIEFVNNWTWFDYNSVYNAQLSLVDWKYNVIFNNSKTYIFNSDLKLESINDNFTNTFSFTYNTDWNLETIADSNNREYTFTYNTDWKLDTITDFNWDKVEFVYYWAWEIDWSEFDLHTIRLTNWTDSKEINFTYSISDTEKLAHNIIKLIDSENNIYVENTYDESDRVSFQKYWTESIYYTYTTDVDDNIIENSVIDREWNNVIYTYDTNWNTTSKLVVKTTWNSLYTYEYDTDNYITKEILPLGNWYSYKYDSNHNMIEKRQKADMNLSDSNDDIVTSYTYNLDFNKPIQIVSPNWAIVNFTLDVNWNIIEKEIIWVEDFDWNVQTIVETYEYNSNWELINNTDANWNISSFEYTDWNLTKTIKTSPQPSPTGEGVEQITTQYIYDTKWNITSITDGEWNITNLSYDDFNLLKTLTTPEWIVSEYNYNKLNKKVNESIILWDLSKVTTSYEYNILDNPTKVTKDIDNSTQKITVVSYDNNSNITEITDWNNATIQFAYNEEWNITSKSVITWSGNMVTSYVYDENNRLTKQINPPLKSGQANSEILFEYDLYDRIVKQTLDNWVYTTLTYDKAGNTLETNIYSGSWVLLQKESNTYDLLNRNTSNTKYDLENNNNITNKIYYDAVWNIVKIIDANSWLNEFEYDEFNRLSQVTDNLWNIITNTYNKNDKLLSRTITWTGWISITTNYDYDNDGRLISETNSLNETISYTYNNLNQVVSKTAKDLTVTTYSYDYTWNLLQETTWTQTTAYEYDINWNMVKLTDANSNITLYEYDNLNRLIKQTYNDWNILTQEYDISWNLTKRTDPNGTIVINNYDSLNRLTSRTIQTATWVLWATSETYTYDELGRLISWTDNLWNDVSFDYDSLNNLISETNSNEIVNYSYDVNWNITSITSPQPSPTGEGAESYSVNYTYDIANRLLSVSNGTDSIANYSYTSLTKLSDTLWNWVTTNYSYDELLRLASLWNYDYTYNTQWNIVNDWTDSYTYDTLWRLTWVNYDKVNQPQYNWDKIERFYYDNLGNRTSSESYTLKEVSTETCTEETVVEDVTLPNGKTKTIERKVNVCETATTQEEKERNSITYNTNLLNQYTKLQSLNKNDEVKKEFTYEYDNNWNLIKDDINQYFYDYKNRLVKVVQNEVLVVDENDVITEVIPEEIIVEFEYDILGRRIEKKTQDKQINYVYAGQNAVEEKIYSFSWSEMILTETRENIYSNEMDDILSVIIADEINNTVEQYYYEKNHLGSIIKITDTAWLIVEQYEYDAFWVAYASVNNVEAVTTAQSKKSLNIKKAKWSEADTWNSDEIVIDNIRYKRYNGKWKIWNTRLYTGREYDAEIQLYYNRARYYSPDLGRFINRDPIDVADDVNLYAYVGNNGVMFVDRVGLSKTLMILWLDFDWKYPIFDNNGYITNYEGSYIRTMFNTLLNTELKNVDFDIKIVDNFSDFDNAINEKQREQIIYIWHGSDNWQSISLDSFVTNSIFIWLFYNDEYKNAFINATNLNNDTQTSVQQKNLENTDLTIYSCHAWDNSNSDSIAEKLLNHYSFNSVRAPTKNIWTIGSSFLKYGIYDGDSSNPWIMKTFY